VFKTAENNLHHSLSISKFINAKKWIATALVPVLMIIAIYSFVNWIIDFVSAPKNPTGEKYKIINFNPVYEKVKIYRESDYESSQGV
jgi:hypothetical protein